MSIISDKQRNDEMMVAVEKAEKNGNCYFVYSRDNKVHNQFGHSRPNWCKQKDCMPVINSQDTLCMGKWNVPKDHILKGINTHSMCAYCVDSGDVFEVDINKTDVWCLRYLINYTFFKEEKMNIPKKHFVGVCAIIFIIGYLIGIGNFCG